MAQHVIQTSFAAGELSPALYARVDIEKYHSGAALMRNWFVDYRGGASTRPGTQFIGQCLPVAGQPRLIPFVVSTIAAYVLEFGDHYVRFIADGAFVIDPATSVPLVVTTPYAVADLPLLKYTQSADVLTLTHSSYPIYNLTRIDATTFSLVEDVIGPVLGTPNIASVIQRNGLANKYTYGYVVTAIDGSGGESLPSIPGYVSGDILNQNAGTLNVVTFAEIIGATSYRVYKTGPTASGSGNTSTPVGTFFGFIGETATITFVDNNIGPDLSQTPPTFQDPFSPGQLAEVQTVPGSGYTQPVFNLAFSCDGTPPTGYGIADATSGVFAGAVITTPGKNNTFCNITDSDANTTVYTAVLGQQSGTYPACVGYFQQRRAFGGTDNFPESLVFSQPGEYDNFNTSPISQASDAITVSLASRQVNAIKSMTAMSTGLIVLTTGGGFLVSGGSSEGAFTPSSVTAFPQASSGCNDLPPLVINYDVLYAQNRGAVVRDLAFNFYVQSYTGTDRSVLASHLFTGHQLLEWTYAEEPFRQIPLIREDGVLLSFTYVPEQEIFAWTHYDTTGAFRSVTSIPEGQINAVYVIVERTIQGASRFYIERFASGLYTSALDAWCLDCALAYDDTPVTVVSGLSHLEGQAVTAVADGMPVYNLTVTAGSVTLPYPASKIIVGLGFTCQLQTLKIDLGEPTVQGSRKLIPAVTARVNNTLGLKVGRTLANVTQMKELLPSPAAMTVLKSVDARTIIDSAWEKQGQVCFQQDAPWPATILGVIPEVTRGDTAR